MRTLEDFKDLKVKLTLMIIPLELLSKGYDNRDNIFKFDECSISEAKFLYLLISPFSSLSKNSLGKLNDFLKYELNDNSLIILAAFKLFDDNSDYTIFCLFDVTNGNDFPKQYVKEALEVLQKDLYDINESAHASLN